MISAINFTGNHIVGQNKPKYQIGITQDGNRYKKSNVYSKLGGGIGAIIGLISMGFGESEKYLCNAHLLADKIFGKTSFYKNGLTGKVITSLALVSGVVTLLSAAGHDLLGLVDKKINQKNAQIADQRAEERLENAIEKVLDEQNSEEQDSVNVLAE